MVYILHRTNAHLAQAAAKKYAAFQEAYRLRMEAETAGKAKKPAIKKEMPFCPVENLRLRLSCNITLLERAILAIDARQTPDEKETRVTKYENGAGWNNADANKGGYIAQYIRTCRKPDGSRLSGRFVQEAKEMMKKYCGQLVRIGFGE